ncbi:MAG: DUF1444 family protein [Pseudomonadota bacterium]
MRYFAKLLFLYLAAWMSAAYAAAPLSQEAFQARYLETLQALNPELQVETTAPLELSVRLNPDEESVKAFLTNAYESYLQEPHQLDEILATYTAGFYETLQLQNTAVDPAKIVPVIKDAAWITEVSGDDDPKERLVFESLNEALVIVYAQDADNTIRYLQPDEFDELELEKPIREIALNNLSALLPELQIGGNDGLFLLVADGTYEVSTLLLEDLWNKKAFPVQGELIVSVPARDVVLVSGTQESDSRPLMEKLTKQMYDESPYKLTQQLFRRKGDGWVLHE